MRRAVVLLTAVAAMAGTADAAAPVRGGAFCWDFDLVGADAADRIEGTANGEHVAAYDGDDLVLAYGGEDCVAAGAGNDVVHLGPGNDQAAGGIAADHLYGGPGDDVLLPGMGPDHADGGDGDDLIRDERGDAAHDVLAGGEGHDVLRALNGAADTVDCGPGYDVAVVDAADTLISCERVAVGRRPRLTARVVRSGVRPAFAIRWSPGDNALPARVAVRVVGTPPRRAGCSVLAWRVGGVLPLRLSWRGRTPPCRGEYAVALTWIDARRGGPRVACDRLRDAPRGGCRPSERLGVLALAVV